MIFHSAYEASYFCLPLIGLIIAFFAVMTGGGGSIAFIPVLIFFFNVPTQTAVTTSLAASLPICIVGTFGYYKKECVNMKMGLTFAITGIIGAISGAGIANMMTSRQLKVCFGIYSILIALPMFPNSWFSIKKWIKDNNLPDSKLRRISKSSFYGFFAGVITSVLGTSGSAPVLAGLFSMRIPLKMVLGTSLMIITVNTISAIGAHCLVGDIDLTLVYFLTVGTVIGAFIGSRFLTGLNTDKAEGPARTWYAIGMIVFGVIVIFCN